MLEALIKTLKNLYFFLKFRISHHYEDIDQACKHTKTYPWDHVHKQDQH